jgi:hypothetical protein
MVREIHIVNLRPEDRKSRVGSGKVESGIAWEQLEHSTIYIYNRSKIKFHVAKCHQEGEPVELPHMAQLCPSMLSTPRCCYSRLATK